ncbi:MAG: hypothetical protein HY849_07685 [Nitrosomonadales bacterium]|nr:hypothetical protein [Nitrosomonadales bacterium]
MIHPAAQILSWMILTLALQLAQPLLLAALGALLLALSLRFSAAKLQQLLRRTRWIMLSLLVIYAYSSPGQPLLESLAAYSPSREGLLDGAMQLGRLFCALAALALLLTRLDRAQLISGIYTLIRPLAYLGIERQHLAVRLALTLHYAESGMLERGAWRDRLRQMLAPPTVEPGVIELPVFPLTLRDFFAPAVSLLLLIAVLS